MSFWNFLLRKEDSPAQAEAEDSDDKEFEESDAHKE